MIRKELLDYIRQFEDNEIVFLLVTSLRHPDEFEGWFLPIPSPKSVFKLIQDKIIDRDYISSKFTLLAPYYDTDEGKPIPANNYLDVRQYVADNIDSYRHLFKGFRIGAMGSKQNCIDSMTDFLVLHNTTLDKVIEATMYYLERENPEYVMNADNFINNEKGSKLAIVMEEVPKSRLL